MLKTADTASHLASEVQVVFCGNALRHVGDLVCLQRKHRNAEYVGMPTDKWLGKDTMLIHHIRMY